MTGSLVYLMLFLAGAVLGGLSSAVIGGFFGFLAASFVEIVRQSLRESLAAERGAVAHPGPDLSRSAATRIPQQPS